MALTKAFTTQHGIELPGAYFRIDTFRGDRQNVRLGVSVYASAFAKEEGKPAIQSLEFTLPTPNTESNMFEAAYLYLKTQDIFTDATDC